MSASEIERLTTERDALLAVVGACEAIGCARQVAADKWEVHNARAIVAERERDALAAQLATARDAPVDARGHLDMWRGVVMHPDYDAGNGSKSDTADCIARIDRALSTPAPRVLTVEQVRLIIERYECRGDRTTRYGDAVQRDAIIEEALSGVLAAPKAVEDKLTIIQREQREEDEVLNGR